MRDARLFEGYKGSRKDKIVFWLVIMGSMFALGLFIGAHAPKPSPTVTPSTHEIKCSQPAWCAQIQRDNPDQEVILYPTGRVA